MLMSELESNATFTTTFKAGKGYEAPWLVLRADTEGDLNAVLEGLLETGTLADVVALANRFGKLYIESQPAPTPPPAAPERNNAPSGLQPAGPAAHNGRPAGRYAAPVRSVPLR